MLRRLKGSRSLCVPSLVDRDGLLVVTETAPALATLREHAATRQVNVSAQIACRMAFALADLHTQPVEHLALTHTLTFDPRQMGAEVLGESWVVRKNLRSMQLSSLNESIGELQLAADMSPQVATHGDIRSDNILAKDALGPITFIDWEFSGRGYRWMDVGSALAILIELAIMVGRGVPDPSIARDLVLRYAERADVTIDLRRVFQCAGIKLLQISAEVAAGSIADDSRIDRLRRAGVMFLTRPYEASVQVGILQ